MIAEDIKNSLGWLGENGAESKELFDEVIASNVYQVSEKTLKGRPVIDIGANMGMFSILAARLGASKVIAAEPVSTTFDKLIKNVWKSESQVIKPQKVVVLDKPGTVKIGLQQKSGHNSLYAAHEAYEEVESTTLKDLLRQVEGNNVFLKMDCEGSEYDILMNATKEDMDRITTIALEVHGDLHPQYRGIEVLQDKLESFGFTLKDRKRIGAWDVDQNGNMINYRDLGRTNEIWERKRVLCSISTRGRYHTTLPLAIQAVINQTRPVDKLVIFDDNDEAKDVREDPVYKNLFAILNGKGIIWEWLFAGKKGPHHNHQIANEMGFEWVWRVDDDAIPEPQVLETLLSYTAEDVGAVGGAILMPGRPFDTSKSTGLLDNIDSEPNIQWSEIRHLTEVDHLHCSFLYRAGVCDYNLGLSRVGHREETMFSYSLKKKGYRNIVVPGATTWHLKSEEGGIRIEKDPGLYAHDEQIFQNFLKFKDNTVVVLNGGMGDHIVFTHVLPELKNPVVFGCYPEIVPGESIASAKQMLGDIEPYSVYKKMNKWGWKGSLESAYRKMYL